MKQMMLLGLIVMTLVSAETPLELFQQGLVKERSEGKLDEAIQLYRRAAESAGKDRALAAKALVQLAAGYEKLGNTMSRNTYEKVVREYADQKEAAELARARLSPSISSAKGGDRRVWTGPEVDMFGRISPDGRYLTYVDWNQTGNLMVHDMVAGTDHPLTKNKSWTDSTGGSNWSSISPDGKQIVYEWWETNGPSNHLVIANFHGTSISEGRRLLISPEIQSIRPFDWSPDGKWIAVHVERTDRSSQIGLVALKDGALRVLRTVDWRGPEGMCFSRDSEYLFYDLPESETTRQRDVFVLAVDGTRGSSLVTGASNDFVIGFSRHGQLLFASDRTGSNALWAQPFDAGRLQGSPTMIKADFGSPWIQGMTASGALYVTKVVSDSDVQIAPVDLTLGKLAASPTGVQRFPSRGRPDWSPDGKFLAYIDCGNFGGGPCTISIRNMRTGQVRELRPELHYFGFPRWSPDGGSFLTSGKDLRNRRGLYLIDAKTGGTTLISDQKRQVAGWSPDGKRIFFTGLGKLWERDLTIGADKELVPVPKGCMGMTISPDGDFAACIDQTKSVLVSVPLSGGEPRELFRAQAPESLVHHAVVSWTLQGRALVVTKRLTAAPQHLGGPRELWLVPLAGSPRKLDIDSNAWDILNAIGARFSPDGRHVAFMGGNGGMEVWALEGLLPADRRSK